MSICKHHRLKGSCHCAASKQSESVKFFALVEYIKRSERSIGLGVATKYVILNDLNLSDTIARKEQTINFKIIYDNNNEDDLNDGDDIGDNNDIDDDDDFDDNEDINKDEDDINRQK